MITLFVLVFHLLPFFLPSFLTLLNIPFVSLVEYFELQLLFGMDKVLLEEKSGLDENCSLNPVYSFEFHLNLLCLLSFPPYSSSIRAILSGTAEAGPWISVSPLVSTSSSL